MFRNNVNENIEYSRFRKRNLKDTDNFIVSEWKLALAGLVLSVFVIICKLYTANRKLP